MKNRGVSIALVIVIWLLASVAWSQTTDPKTKVIRLDLATLPVGQTTTRPGGSGTYAFVLVNKIPSVTYTIHITRSFVAMPPLTFPGLSSQAGSNAEPRAFGVKPTCADVSNDLSTALTNATTEVKVKESGATAIAAAKDISPTCEADIRKEFAKNTELPLQDDRDGFIVGEAETLTVVVSRPEASWTIVLEGTTVGEWRTSYGFFFVPDRDKKYFVEETHPTTTTSIFKIKEQAHRQRFDFVPTVLFTFLPNSQVGKTWANGWTAGLGYDLEKPVLVAGYAGTYNENVTFTAGVAFHRQSRLLGRYHAGDEVKETIESSQLVEDTYAPNVYVGVSFRFGEDIHARRKELEKQAAAAKTEAAAAKAQAAQAEKDAADRKAACAASADAAEAAAKQKCKDDALCLATAAADAAAAKAKCAVTEQEKRDAEAAKKKADTAVEEADTLKRCDDAADAAKTAELDTCGDIKDSNAAKAAAAKLCRDKAEKTFTDSRKKCKE